MAWWENARANSSSRGNHDKRARPQALRQAGSGGHGESGLRFDSTVPVEEIACPPAEIAGLKPEDYEIIDTKVTERLCQRSSYYVKRYLRPVVKIKASKVLVNEPAPEAVFERSYADATLLIPLIVSTNLHHEIGLLLKNHRLRRSLTAYAHPKGLINGPWIY